MRSSPEILNVKGARAFSLTLTLSRWERGQQAFILSCLNTIRAMQPLDLLKDGVRFSLSQRERASTASGAADLCSDWVRESASRSQKFTTLSLKKCS
ncbi:MAG: hypothetical protein JWM68_677 [Verrucomicrobiales bacterium]|nr:hypothetical protein [Verrucomicrobiales bacterium]